MDPSPSEILPRNGHRDQAALSSLVTGDSDHVTITSPKPAFGAVGKVCNHTLPHVALVGISQDRFRVAVSRAGPVARLEP
jgi:hypothetical protein